ncbi:MAG: type III pantothenate kinase, partial [Clostridia bacterium]|nr:type III pantothenate kinase [Clostridia bacterium]
MLLVIDAGNTNITIGAYQGDELTFTSRLATDHRATRDRIAVDLASIFKL